MFADFFYSLRQTGVDVSMNEWLTLIEAMDMGLSNSSLTEFYYLSRSILVKTEADFDKFDLAFAKYFKGIESPEQLPQELIDWLNDVQPQKPFNKEEVDQKSKNLGFDEVRKLLKERLEEQKERHDGGSYWVGTGGVSTMGNSGYNPVGIRVGGESKNRSALQVATERKYKDFREDETLEMRQFQMAFRRLRQFSMRQDGPKDILDLEETIDDTCNNAGRLKLVFQRPRHNTVKLLILFDSGGSMWPYTKMCNTLFQAVSKSNHFKDLKVYYFHNCFYEQLYTTPRCVEKDSVETDWVFHNLSSEYKVIVVGDAAMAVSELTHPGGRSYYYQPNDVPGMDWLRRAHKKYERMIWMNPLPKRQWEDGWGHQTIGMIAQEFPMYHLSVKGLEEGLKNLLVRK